MLQEGGHPATDATRQAILTTLRALPSDEPAGRLTRALQPGGFEMLAGLSIGGGRKVEFRKKRRPNRAEDRCQRESPSQGKDRAEGNDGRGEAGA